MENHVYNYSYFYLFMLTFFEVNLLAQPIRCVIRFLSEILFKKP